MLCEKVRAATPGHCKSTIVSIWLYIKKDKFTKVVMEQ